MKIINDIYYTDSKNPFQVLDVCLPENESFAVLIYYHGGGLENGNQKVGQDTFIKGLVEKGVAVVSANYRMYPDAKYPDFINDAASAAAWALKNMKNYGNPLSFFIGGSSAGGYLSQMLCFDERYLAKHNIDADSISGYIHDAGQPTVHFNVLRERGFDTRKIIVDEASPLYFVNGTRKYPPMQIIYAEHDMQNRPEQTRLLISTLEHFGCDMEKVDVRYMKCYNHCEYNHRLDENNNSVFADIMFDFIRKYGSI